MPVPSHEQVLRAMSPTIWGTSNRALYDLCREHPGHRDDGEIIAKVLQIGRVYSAAIERRRDKENENKDEEVAGTDNDKFYIRTVAPAIKSSDIDEWLLKARTTAPDGDFGLQTIVEVHGQVTNLFSDISKMEKRSLASKYLHFHVPHMFYIFDTRAVKAMREFSDVLPRATRLTGHGDDEYRKFAEKANSLVRLCEEKFGLSLSPRQLDNLLLKVNE